MLSLVFDLCMNDIFKAVNVVLSTYFDLESCFSHSMILT